MTDNNETDDAEVPYAPPTRWPYRIEGVVLGIPLTYLVVLGLGREAVPILGAIGLLLVVGMQYGGCSR